MIAGKQSIKFDNNVYIKAGATVAGTKEKKGPLGCCFDVVSQDDLFGGESWEEAESRIQSLAFEKLLEKTGMMPEDIRYIYAGDLLGQFMVRVQLWASHYRLRLCVLMLVSQIMWRR